jgi:hypothetical protein
MLCGQTRRRRSQRGGAAAQVRGVRNQLLSCCINTFVTTAQRFAKRLPVPSRLSTIATSSAEINSIGWSNR